MFHASREFVFCYGHRLLDYEGKCRHLHGHNAKVVVTVAGSGLDQRGMVLDFGEIKSTIEQWVDEHLDHRMLLRKDDPIVETLQAVGEPLFLTETNPTAENLAKLIFDEALRLGLAVIRVEFWETPKCKAVYHGPGGE